MNQLIKIDELYIGLIYQPKYFEDITLLLKNQIRIVQRSNSPHSIYQYKDIMTGKLYKAHRETFQKSNVNQKYDTDSLYHVELLTKHLLLEDQVSKETPPVTISLMGILNSYNKYITNYQANTNLESKLEAIPQKPLNNLTFLDHRRTTSNKPKIYQLNR